MLVILSPSKTIRKNTDHSFEHFTLPVFLSQAEQVVNTLKKLNTEELRSILKTSPKLTYEAQESFQLWNLQHSTNNSTQSILAFNGDVYAGMNAGELSNDTFLYSQDHLIILSGLYGALRPFDLIQNYRLDVGNSLKIGKDNLYSFWKRRVTDFVNRQLLISNNHYLVNLASHEYFSMLGVKSIKGKMITPVFKDYSSGKYKIVSVFAKKARGKMARFIFENKVNNPEVLKTYEGDGYYYDENTSTSEIFTFLRR
jgi:hypothetical protein